jgi:hypothetical protein
VFAFTFQVAVPVVQQLHPVTKEYAIHATFVVGAGNVFLLWATLPRSPKPKHREPFDARAALRLVRRRSASLVFAAVGCLVVAIVLNSATAVYPEFVDGNPPASRTVYSKGGSASWEEWVLAGHESFNAAYRIDRTAPRLRAPVYLHAALLMPYDKECQSTIEWSVSVDNERVSTGTLTPDHRSESKRIPMPASYEQRDIRLSASRVDSNACRAEVHLTELILGGAGAVGWLPAL